MYQTDRGTYRTRESAFKQFRHSCLGKLVMAVAFIVILLFIAWMTNPTEEKMRAEMLDNIRQSIESRDSIQADWMDIVVSNAVHTFTTADSLPNKERLDLFNKYNVQEYFDNSFYSTMYVLNTLSSQEELGGVGLFGLVIPTVNFNRFLPREGPMHKEYNEPLIKQGPQDDEYYGETHVDVFRYEGE